MKFLADLGLHHRAAGASAGCVLVSGAGGDDSNDESGVLTERESGEVDLK